MSELRPEFAESPEAITSQRIAEVCQGLLANAPEEACRLSEDDLQQFEAMSPEDAYMCGLNFLYAAGIENPEELLKRYGIV